MGRIIIFVFVMTWATITQSGDTDLRFYRPFTESPKQLPVTLGEKKSGSCMEQSLIIKREDAWRCLSEGRVYDPCFVDKYSKHLDAVCLATPWVTSGIQITVQHPLDNTRHEFLDMSKTLPWALELISGERCQSIVSTQKFDGLPVRYQCETNTELVGHVQRCDSQWKILQHSSKGMHIVSINRAWF